LAEHLVEGESEPLDSFASESVNHLRLLSYDDGCAHEILHCGLGLAGEGEFAQFAVVLLRLGGSLGVEAVVGHQALQLLVLLFAQVGYRLPHLNYNRTILHRIT
jgi:hypothetical protein